MLLIQQVTSNPLQEQTIVLPDGSQLSMTLYFRPMQYGWFINRLVYGDFLIYGVRITNSPNILNQFRNQIPFGLGCFSTANREPSQQSDFSTGASKLYILTKAECQEYAEYLKLG